MAFYKNFKLMKVISYNVNGIRAAIKNGLIDWLKAANPDILCLQEIKATIDVIPTELFEAFGYNFQYYFPAQKKGYSGVAILSKIKPKHIAYGTGIKYMDDEGRNIRADFDGFSIMSLYLPSGTNDDRLGFKFQYMSDFFDYSQNLLKEIPNLIICGDYNICHKPIDIHDPIRNKNVSGFLPEERAWLDKFIHHGFIDSLRLFNQMPDQYSWWSYRANARQNNKGWRIDYHLVSENLSSRLNKAYILPEAKHSDHCPVVIEF